MNKTDSRANLISSFATAPLIDFTKPIDKVVIKINKSERQRLWEERERKRWARRRRGLEEETHPDTGREDVEPIRSNWSVVM